MKPPVSIHWRGSKRRLLKYILPLIGPHVCYCEPFAGSLALLLAKPPSRLEVINDINQDLIGFYLCVKYHAGELGREVQGMLGSRALFQAFRASPGLTQIQRAARFFYRQQASFGANGHSFGVCKTAKRTAFFDAPAMEVVFKGLADRLRAVTIECLPYDHLLRNQDAPETLFFCDPPYIGGDCGTYEAWSEDQTAEFATRIRGLRGQWICTLGDSPFVRRLFSGYRIIAVQTQNQGRNTLLGGAKTFGEVIILSNGLKG